MADITAMPSVCNGMGGIFVQFNIFRQICGQIYECEAICGKINGVVSYREITTVVDSINVNRFINCFQIFVVKGECIPWLKLNLVIIRMFGTYQ